MLPVYFYMLQFRVHTDARYLLLDELQLHVLDLDPDQEEVNLPNYHVLQVVSGSRNTESISNGLKNKNVSLESGNNGLLT